MIEHTEKPYNKTHTCDSFAPLRGTGYYKLSSASCALSPNPHNNSMTQALVQKWMQTHCWEVAEVDYDALSCESKVMNRDILLPHLQVRIQSGRVPGEVDSAVQRYPQDTCCFFYFSALPSSCCFHLQEEIGLQRGHLNIARVRERREESISCQSFLLRVKKPFPEALPTPSSKLSPPAHSLSHWPTGHRPLPKPNTGKRNGITSKPVSLSLGLCWRLVSVP